MTWIQTRTGRAFDFLDPRPDMIDFEEIAETLAKIPRFNAHTEGDPYSVGQHCVLGADHCVKEFDAATALAFALHDAHEAFVGDMTRPLQEAYIEIASSVGIYGPALKFVFDGLKAYIDVVIHAAAGFVITDEIRARVRRVDVQMLKTEQMQLHKEPPKAWAESAEPLPIEIYPWSWRMAKWAWLRRFEQLRAQYQAARSGERLAS
jgi:hypothetical protein